MLGWSSEDRQLITEMHGAQIEMGTNLKWVMKKLKEADSEEGYKRCVARKAAVDTLTEDVAEVKKSFKWIRNTMVGGLVSTVVIGCGAAANFMMGN